MKTQYPMIPFPLISVTVAFITFKILPSKFIFFILISTLKLPF